MRCERASTGLGVQCLGFRASGAAPWTLEPDFGPLEGSFEGLIPNIYIYIYTSPALIKKNEQAPFQLPCSRAKQPLAASVLVLGRG